MDEIKYRTATSEDSNRIAELPAISWRANYRGEYKDEYLDGDVFEDRIQVWTDRFGASDPDQHVVIAESNEQIVGFACVYGAESEGWASFLDNIHVRPGQQSQGIGRGLMEEVFKWCRVQHPDAGLYIWVLQSNIQGQKFYKYSGASDRGGELSVPAGGGEIHGRRYAWDAVPH